MKSSSLSFVQSYKTDIGKIRKENQDSYAVVRSDDWSLLVVCDGMGGTKGGSIASILAIEVILKRLSLESRTPDLKSVQKAMEEANQVLYVYGKGHEGLEEMGTTALVFFCSANSSFVCHVGDSRLYRLRGSFLEQITKDHTWVQELVDSGAMAPVNAEKSPVSHLLTRAFGTKEDIEIESQVLDKPKAEDFYFLCSDGLYGAISSELIRETVLPAKAENIDVVLDSLVKHALDAGGKDNITITALYVDAAQTKEKLLGKTPEIVISGNSGIDIDQLLYDINERASMLSAIADEVSRDISPELLSDKNVSQSQTSFITVFILGVFCSVVVLLYLTIKKEDDLIASSGEGAHGGPSFVVSDKQSQQRLSRVRAAVEESKNQEIVSAFSMSPSPFADVKYVQTYLDELVDGFYLVSKSVPQVALPIKRRGGDEKPVRPIVWENEAELLEQFRGNTRKNTHENFQVNREEEGKADKVIPGSLDSLPSDSKTSILSNEESITLIEEKEAVRFRLAEADEKIRQLGIRNKKEKESRLKDLQIRSEILNDDILEMNKEDDRLRKQILHLESFKKEVEAGNFIQIAERLVPFENSLRIALQQVRNINQEIVNIRRILKNTNDEIVLAQKLSALLRDKTRVESSLRSSLKTIIDFRESRIHNHRGLLKYAVALLSYQRNFVLRSIGYLNAYTDLHADRVHELAKSMTAERDALYLKLETLQKTLSDKEEIERSTILYKKIGMLDFS